ncbi:hypothetical protein ACFFRR_011360 [Megaselia abdita]
MKKKRRVWEDREIQELLKVWRVNIDELWKNRRHSHVYQHIASTLNSMGFQVSAPEVNIKINNLTQTFRREKNQMKLSNIPTTWKFYREVGEILDKIPKGESYKVTGDDSNDFFRPVDTTSQWGGGGMDTSMDMKSSIAFPQNFPQNDSFQRKRTYPNGDTEGTPVKSQKPEDNDLVNLIKTIIEEKQNQTQELSKIETFCNFLKSYMNTWPERAQDEAINHITNYLVYKNIEINGTSARGQQTTNGMLNHQSN